MSVLCSAHIDEAVRTDDGVACLARSRAKTWAVRFIAAQVVVLLWFGPYLAKFLEDETRFLYMWEPADAASMLGIMFGLAVGCTVACWLVRLMRRRLLTLVFDHLFVIALAGALLDNVAFHWTRTEGYSIARDGMEVQTAWLAAMGLVGFSLARGSRRLVYWSRQLCLASSPLLVILSVQLLRPVYYPPTRDPLPLEPRAASVAAESAEEAMPVYLFILDEWSYDRTYENGTLRSIFPNLASLSDRAVVFHDAHSPGPDTRQSVPQLLCQVDLPARHQAGGYGFERDGQLIDMPRGRSLFSIADHADYLTVMVGFCQPFGRLLGDEVDVCRSYKSHGCNDGLLGRAGTHAFKTMQYSTHPWLDFAYRRFGTGLHYRYAVELYENIRQDAADILTRVPRNSFAVIHCPLPHGPFIFAADGSYQGATDAIWQDTVENYDLNLRQLDRQVGAWVKLMKQRETFDASLLILLSDHAWRRDPDNSSRPRGDWLTHVPLIVKLPHQRSPVVITRRYKTMDVGRVIESVLESGGDPAEVRGLAERMAAKSASQDPCGTGFQPVGFRGPRMHPKDQGCGQRSRTSR